MSEQAEAAWIAYRNEIQRRTPWENHRRAMRRLRKREFIAGYSAALTTQQVEQQEESTDGR